jgi:hypothetical protein
MASLRNLGVTFFFKNSAKIQNIADQRCSGRVVSWPIDDRMGAGQYS